MVESCLILDTSAWRRAGILRPGALRGGYWRWPGALTLGYVLDTQDLGKAMLGLLEPTSQTDVFLAVRIPLDTTLTPKGGVRFWWCCSECSRRSGKLFQPPGASHFACRGCHGLTYTSTQQNHCHDRLHALLAARAPGTTSAHWHAQRMLPQRLAPSSFLVAGGTSLASRGEVTSPHGGGEQCGWRRRWES